MRFFVSSNKKACLLTEFFGSSYMVVFRIISDNSGRAGSRWGFLLFFGGLGEEAFGKAVHEALGLGHFSL